MLRLLFLFNLLTLTYASYCGQSAIPFSIEILHNGQPVLGCARPTCFGWNTDGDRSADPATFYKIGERMDGFLRSTDRAGLAIKNASIFQPQFSRNFLSDRCIGPNQWVGGIFPSAKINSQESMKIMCCTYERLRDSVNKGILKLRPGQSVQGGEMRNENGRQHGFEYVSSIERMFDEHGVVYTVNMRSFKCVPEPNGPAEVEYKADKYLIDNIDAIDHPTTTPRPRRTRPAPVIETKFDEQTFELPEDMPSEDTRNDTSNLPHRRIVGDTIPVAQPYEEDVISSNLNNIQRQVNEKNAADSDGFRARVHGAPTLTSDTPSLIQQQPASSVNSRPLIQSHSPQYPQVPTNPLDPFGLFGNNGLLPGWYIPTPPPRPSSRLLPLDIPSVEDVEKAIPDSSRKIIAGVARTLLNHLQ